MSGLASICTDDFKMNNINYSWLYTTPSSLLWADKIYVTEYMNECLGHTEDPVFSKSLNMGFDVLDEYDLIKVKNSRSIFNESVSQKLDNLIINDLEKLSELYPSNVKYDFNANDHLNISIGDKKYCYPMIKSIYVNLKLANKWNAQSLFSNNEINFLKYGMGMNNSNCNSITGSFEDVFNLYLPNDPPFVKDIIYLGEDSKCPLCKRYSFCVSERHNKLDNNLRKYLEIREYEEISQIKDVVYKINKKVNSSNQLLGSEEIKQEFLEQRNVLNKRMSLFPKVEKWSRYSLLASVTAGTIGLYVGSTTLVSLGGLLGFASNGIDAIIGNVKNKYKWIGFKVEDEYFNS